MSRVSAVAHEERARGAAAQASLGVGRRQLGHVELTVVELKTVRDQPLLVTL